VLLLSRRLSALLASVKIGKKRVGERRNSEGH
jgi:hypothetical protein